MNDLKERLRDIDRNPPNRRERHLIADHIERLENSCISYLQQSTRDGLKVAELEAQLAEAKNDSAQLMRRYIEAQNANSALQTRLAKAERLLIRCEKPVMGSLNNYENERARAAQHSMGIARYDHIITDLKTLRHALSAFLRPIDSEPVWYHPANSASGVSNGEG